MRGKGFVPAGGLAVGNAIVTRAGPALVVQAVKWNRRAEAYKVYNFVVEDDHSYFVGRSGGGAWVHNPGDCASQLARIFRRYPISSGECARVARQVQVVLQRSGQANTQIIELVDRSGAPILRAADGTDIAIHGFHRVVESNGRYYDAFTGPSGATWEDYLKFWHPDTGPYLIPR